MENIKYVRNTPEMEKAYQKLVVAHGEPLEQWYDALCGCYMVQYSWSLIGIEKDGYTHS